MSFIWRRDRAAFLKKTMEVVAAVSKKGDEHGPDLHKYITYIYCQSSAASVMSKTPVLVQRLTPSLVQAVAESSHWVQLVAASEPWISLQLSLFVTCTTVQ